MARLCSNVATTGRPGHKRSPKYCCHVHIRPEYISRALTANRRAIRAYRCFFSRITQLPSMALYNSLRPDFPFIEVSLRGLFAAWSPRPRPLRAFRKGDISPQGVILEDVPSFQGIATVDRRHVRAPASICTSRVCINCGKHAGQLSKNPERTRGGSEETLLRQENSIGCRERKFVTKISRGYEYLQNQ